jgi:hypothetical protein
MASAIFLLGALIALANVLVGGARQAKNVGVGLTAGGARVS